MPYLTKHHEDLLVERLGGLGEPCDLVVSSGSSDSSSAAMLDLVDYLVTLAPTHLNRHMEPLKALTQGPILRFKAAKNPDLGIEFWGTPSGHEFLNLIDGIELATGRAHTLDPVTVALLAQMSSVVSMKIFVTPT